MGSEPSERTDPAQKQNLKLELELEEAKIRRRSFVNLKIIGELYKLNLLGMATTMPITGTLLKKGDGEPLECLCQLLTTDDRL